MKLTYESHGEIITLTTTYDTVGMAELFQLYKQLTLGAGFHPKTVAAYFTEEVDS